MLPALCQGLWTQWEKDTAQLNRRDHLAKAFCISLYHLLTQLMSIRGLSGIQEALCIFLKLVCGAWGCSGSTAQI